MTVDELREFITTDLSDAALQTLLDAAEAEVEAYAPAGGTVQLVDNPYGRKIALKRPAASITSVTELVGSTTTTLAADDYRLWPDGYILERLNTGTNKRSWWPHGLITITFAAGDDADIRDAVTVALVRLDLDEDASTGAGVKSRTLGDFSETFADADIGKTIEDRRAEILARLGGQTDGYMLVVGG